MTSPAATRIARLHPGFLTGALVLTVAVQMASLTMQVPAVAAGVLMALPLGLMCGWLWSIYTVSRRASPESKSTFWSLIFLVPPAVALCAGIADWSTRNSPAAFAIFAALFVGITLAAKTLEKVDAAAAAPSVGRMLGTAILMYFAPVGVWVLRPKILRVASRPAAGASPT